MKKFLLFPLVLIGLALVGAGCIFDGPDESQRTDPRVETSAVVQETQRKLQDATPPPKLTTSAERQNVVRRLEAWNDDSKIGYVYLVSFGKVMAFYTVKGKVSSLNSFLVPDEALVRADGTKCERNISGNSSGGYVWEPCYEVSSPDLDGTYGTNDNGIFFFTTENAYVEWKGQYMFVDQPLKLTTPPELIREIK